MKICVCMQTCTHYIPSNANAFMKKKKKCLQIIWSIDWKGAKIYLRGHPLFRVQKWGHTVLGCRLFVICRVRQSCVFHHCMRIVCMAFWVWLWMSPVHVWQFYTWSLDAGNYMGWWVKKWILPLKPLLHHMEESYCTTCMCCLFAFPLWKVCFKILPTSCMDKQYILYKWSSATYKVLDKFVVLTFLV